MNAKNELEQCTLAEFCWQHLSISIWTCLTQFFFCGHEPYISKVCNLKKKKKHCEASMTMADIQSEMARSKGPRFMYLYRGNLIFVE